MSLPIEYLSVLNKSSGEAALIDALLDALGADLWHWWEPSSDTITLHSNGNLRYLDDRITGVASRAIQEDENLSPAYSATSGPNNRPGVTLQSTSRVMSASISIPADHRVGFYALLKADGLTRIAARITGSGNNIMQPYWQGTTAFRALVDFTAAIQNISITSPAKDTNWHLRALRPLATGALCQIDGSTTTPNFTGSGTVKAMDTFQIGQGVSSGGVFASAMLVDNPTAAKDTAVKNYYRSKFNLAIAA